MKHQGHGNTAAFLLGFAISMILTILAFALVGFDLVNGTVAIIAICFLALVQLTVQLVFFLHLGREKQPRWNGKMFGFTAVVIVILVAGTIWVMNNLNYNMTGQDAADYLLQDEGLKY